MAKSTKGKLVLSDTTMAKIAALRKKTGAKDDAQTVRQALRIYENLLKPEDDSAVTPR